MTIVTDPLVLPVDPPVDPPIDPPIDPPAIPKPVKSEKTIIVFEKGYDDEQMSNMRMTVDAVNGKAEFTHASIETQIAISMPILAISSFADFFDLVTSDASVVAVVADLIQGKIAVTEEIA